MQRDKIAVQLRLGTQEFQKIFHVTARVGCTGAVNDGGTAEPYRMARFKHGFGGGTIQIEVPRIVDRSPERPPVRLIPDFEVPVAYRQTEARVASQLIEEA